jgi:hypothetical protein
VKTTKEYSTAYSHRVVGSIFSQYFISEHRDKKKYIARNIEIDYEEILNQ